ncbi:hypothetical protein ONE63_009563 [Megalurothrips usitatus]|uniref:Uncharacterized protein n=1 Tax=Megalurothrips usitatus TaxID=439358 RepID=A0AAV7XP82_9NEOP|nr:hypothetical protein ONE63_009563 [Megalurothrips usitatus]
MLMTLSLGHRHNLPWVAIVDILKMQNAIYGKKKVLTSKLSFMNRLLENNRLEVRNHYFCDECSVYMAAAEPAVSSIVCEYCSTTINMAKSTIYFASISLESQLKELLADKQVAESILTYRFNRVKDSEENLEDIYDGSEYKQLSAPGGILAQPENFSFSFFVDGVTVGKTKKSMWPIYVTITELPPKERQKHMLLAGLYYGPHDPDQKVFLKPFVEEVNKLSSSGVSWFHDGRNVISKVIPLIAVVDSVARCQCMNMQTFSAFYGCTFCYQKTERTVKRLKFVIPSEPAKERTRESYERDVMKAYEKRFEVREEDQHYKGVKGPCSLARLNYFNLFTGFVVDYMHNILLGVTKTYFQLIFDCSRAKFWQNSDDAERFAMEDIMSQIDARLLSGMKPPTCISRTPRSLKDHGNWKANERRNWLLFYSIPCLEDILKKNIYIIYLSW